LIVPVKNANAVASMRFGVIFAKTTMSGSLTKHWLMTSVTTSVKMMTNMSEIP
jgi:hypothetical protein